jgi:HAD superfamily hydrolase (TIGR01509 family)
MTLIKAVAWDVDGTLVDSEPLHQKALLACCADYQVDISHIPVDRFIGVNLLDVWDALGELFPPGLPMESWIGEINRHYVKGRDELRATPFAVETVRSLKKMGLRQVAVSNSNRTIVDTNLETIGLTSTFESSLSLDDVTEGKPSPVPYLLASQRLGLHPGEMMAVEDSASGTTSSARAGCVTVGFSPLGGFLPGVDHRLRSLCELPSLISRYCVLGESEVDDCLR